MKFTHLIIAAALTAALTAALGGFASAAQATEVGENLIDGSPESVLMLVPAPGNTETWELSVKNQTGSTLPLGLEISGEQSALFQGETPLTINLVDDQGAVVVSPTAVSQVLGRTVPLPQLEPGASYKLHGTALLPQAANNSYSELSGKLVFRFVTIKESAATPPEAKKAAFQPETNTAAAANNRLALTGADGMNLGQQALVLITIFTGLGLLLLKKHRFIAPTFSDKDKS